MLEHPREREHGGEQRGGVVDPRILERNLERLLTHAYRPVEPPPEFEARLLSSMRARQARGLGDHSSRAWAAAAACTLLALAAWWTGSTLRRGVHAIGAESGFLRLARAGERWERVHGTVPLRRGDRVATPGDDRLSVRWPDGRRLDLEAESILELDEENAVPLLERGAAEARERSRDTHLLETPICRIHTRGARYRVQVSRAPPAPPIAQEVIAMNRKTAAASVAGALIIVTVIVYWNATDEDVVVESPKGETALIAGQTGTFASDGSVSVEATEEVAATEPGALPEAQEGAEEGAEETPSTTPAAGMEAIAGMVVSARGEPLPGATLRFLPLVEENSEAQEEGPVSVAAVTSTTGEDGAFELEVPSGSEGRIEASLERHISATVAWPVEEPTAEEEAGDVEPPAEEITITLNHETAIAGSVTLPDGAHPEGSFLVAIQRVASGWEYHDPIVRTFESEDGSFYFGGVQPARYQVWAYFTGYQRSDPASAHPAEGEVDDGIKLSLIAGASLRGVAFDKRSGRPVSGVIVYPHLAHLPGTVNYAMRSEVSPKVRNAGTTDGEGRFLLQDLPAGKHLIRILHPDYVPVDYWLELAEEEVVELEIELREGTGIRGQVLDERGEPYENAAVVALTMSSIPKQAHISIGEVDEEGRYFIRNLQPGQYIVVRLKDLEGEDPDNAKVTMENVPADRDAIVDFIEIAELATLRGRVVNRGGDPVPSASVSLMRVEKSGEFTFKSGLTDEDGRFEIRNLSLSEDYQVGVGFGYSTSMVVVGRETFGDPIDYEREYQLDDMEVNGRVTSEAGGGPIEHAELMLLRMREGGSGADFAGRVETDVDGAYVLLGATAGDYVLRAAARGHQIWVSEAFSLEDPGHTKKTIDVSLKAGGSVRVTVLDGEGNPLEGGWVTIKDAGGETQNHGLPPLTDHEGRYSFHSLSPGRHSARVRLEADSETLAQEEFDVEQGKMAEVTIRLDAGEER